MQNWGKRKAALRKKDEPDESRIFSAMMSPFRYFAGTGNRHTNRGDREERPVEE